MTYAARSARRAPAIRLLASALALLTVLTPGVASASQTPDIVVIMLDDLAPVPGLLERMPTIRRLFIDQGITFSAASGETPLCCPARANFLTGQHTHRHGVTRNDGTLLDPSATIVTELKGAGYWTAIAGKYLNRLSAIEDKTPPGWDSVAIMTAGYYDYDVWIDGVPGHRGVATTDYSTDVFRDHAVSLLNDAPSAPRFLFFTPYAPHQGADRFGNTVVRQPVPAERHRGSPKCASSPPYATPAFQEEDVSDKPAYIQAKPVTGQTGWPTVRTCEALLAVDQAIKKLERAQAGRDVIWILLADNGMGYGSHRWWRKVAPYTAPIPLFAHWASGRGTQARVETQAVSNIDLAPTLCGIAGCTMESADGIDWSRLLADRDFAIPRDMILEQSPEAIKEVPAWWAVRSPEWHYVRYETGDRELYDLVADPWELTNLAHDPDYDDTQAYYDARLTLLVGPT